MKPFRYSTLIATTAALALLAPAAPVHAVLESETAADHAAEKIAEVAPTDLVAAELQPVGSGLVAKLDGGGRTVLADEPAQGIEVTSADGAEVLSFSLPAAARLDDAAVAGDGSVTYEGDAKTPSVNVVPAEDALRVTTVIDHAAQAKRFAYDFGAGATVEVQKDGSAIAYVNERVTDPRSGETRDAEKIIADIAAPWAKDANGVDVPTRYEASGSVLTQVVSHAAGDYAYPVIADPTFDRPNIFQYRVRFNRAETSIIYQHGLGALGGFACGAMAPVCLLAAGSLVWNAGIAEKSRPKRCVQVTATQPYIVPGLIWWVDTYSGGPCR